jgi:glycosyltransferase involved in cell wall biosynthesis
VLDLARGHGLIVHSEHVAERARAAGFDAPIRRIPMPVWPAPAVEPAAIEGDPVVGSFGFLNANKRIPQLLEAFAVLRERHPRARLLLVGPEAAGLELGRRVASLGLEGAVERHGYVDEERLWSLLAACDVAVSLRWPTMGETSAGAIRVLSVAKPLVVSDVDAFRELPDDVALKVAPDEREAESLAASLLLLAGDPARREAMSAAARTYAAREHELGRVADLYVAALEEAAGGGVVNEELLREVARGAGDVGLDDEERLGAALREVGLGR